MHSQKEQYKIDWDSFSDPVSQKYQYRTTGDPYHCTDPIPETFSIGFHSSYNKFVSIKQLTDLFFF